jgi:hypothetical protein
VLECCPLLYNVAGEWSFLRQNPYGAVSQREERVTAFGDPVWRMLYRLREGREAQPARALSSAAADGSLLGA